MSYCEVITPIEYEMENDGAEKLLHLKIMLKKQYKEFQLHTTNTGSFITFSVIANIYNKKTPNASAEPSTLLFLTSIAP
jgi:hypothetical protein